MEEHDTRSVRGRVSEALVQTKTLARGGWLRVTPIVEFAFKLIPGLGDFQMLYEGITGREIFTRTELEWFGRIVLITYGILGLGAELIAILLLQFEAEAFRDLGILIRTLLISARMGMVNMGWVKPRTREKPLHLEVLPKK